MRKVWIIARQEYLTNLRRPGFIIWTLLVPVLGLLGLLIAAFFGGQASNILHDTFVPPSAPLGFVDRSGIFTPVLPEYADTFLVYTDEQAGRADLQAGEIDTFLIFPADYLETGRVQMVTRTGNPNMTALDDSERFIKDHLLRDQVDPQLAARIRQPVDPVMVALSQAEAGEAASGGIAGMLTNMMVPYFLGILLVMSIFTASGYLMRGVAEEKTSRVIEIVLSSVSAWQLLAGKVLGLGALGLTQIGVWLASSFALSGGALGLLGVAIPLLSRPELFILGITYYLLGFLIFAVLMGAGGSLGTTQQESQQIAGMFSFMAAIPLMIAGFIFSNPNATIARVLSWFPLTAPTMMMMRITLGEIPAVDIIGSIILCTLSVPLIVWLGAKVFRTGLLMYGKRPSLREIGKLLRTA